MATDLLVVGDAKYLKYDIITYRDLSITFFSDPAGDLIVAQLPSGELLDLGYHNINYREETCRVIDRQLDLVTTFPDNEYEQAAKLEYFNNAGYRDIRLLYRGRVLKVFLVSDAVDIDIVALVQEAKKALTLYGINKLPED